MDRETDLIIVGAGAAGLSAALTAVELGLKVIILEKRAVIGGSSILSGGSLAFAATDIQSQLGIDDGDDLLFRDLREVGQQENDEAIVTAYVAHQAETYRWLKETGVNFAPTVKLSPGSSVARTHTADPAIFLPLLLDRIEGSGRAEILYGAHVEFLETEESGRSISGVTVGGSDSGSIRARLGVILASGGFTRSPDLIHRFSPRYSGGRVSGGVGNTGDGLLMAWKLGADFVDVANIQGNYGTSPEGEGLQPVHAIYKGAIAVNQDGRRFVDESKSYKVLADACVAQPGKISFQIFDQSVFEKGDDSIPMYSFKSRLGIGQLLSADSLEDLGALIDVHAEALLDTVARYNTGVDRGVDPDYGRISLDGGKGELLRIDRPPFYAFRTTVVLLGTYCGLRVDERMQVLDVYGMEIPQLYAAGEIVGGLHGRSELPGTALGKALVFGRLAARSAAGSG